MKRPTKGSGDAEQRGTPQTLSKNNNTVSLVCVYVGLADAAADSPFMTAVLIFLETMKLSVLGQCPQTAAIYRDFTAGQSFLTSMCCFGDFVLTIVSPVHFTLEDGTTEGLWRLFAGTVFISGLKFIFTLLYTSLKMSLF